MSCLGRLVRLRNELDLDEENERGMGLYILVKKSGNLNPWRRAVQSKFRRL